MPEITDLTELIRTVQAGARVWQKSDRYPDLYFWNTTGQEHRVDFPTIFAKKEILKQTTAQLVD